MKKALVMAVAIIFSISASAQLISSNTITKTKKKNYNRWSISYNSISMSHYSESFNGVSLDWTKGISVSKNIPLYIETGLGLTYAVATEDDGDKNAFLALTVPVNVVYRYAIGDTGCTLAPYAGLYLRGIPYGASYYDYDDEWDGWEDYNFLQVGIRAGVGFEYKKLYLGISYGTDFTDLWDDVTLSTFSATIGITF